MEASDMIVPIVCCSGSMAVGAFCAWVIALDLGYRKAKAQDSGIVDDLESSLAAAIKERDRLQKWSDKLEKHFKGAAIDAGRAGALIGVIAELIERYDAETCGEGEE